MRIYPKSTCKFYIEKKQYTSQEDIVSNPKPLKPVKYLPVDGEMLYPAWSDITPIQGFIRDRDLCFEDWPLNRRKESAYLSYEVPTYIRILKLFPAELRRPPPVSSLKKLRDARMRIKMMKIKWKEWEKRKAEKILEEERRREEEEAQKKKQKGRFRPKPKKADKIDLKVEKSKVTSRTNKVILPIKATPPKPITTAPVVPKKPAEKAVKNQVKSEAPKSVPAKMTPTKPKPDSIKTNMKSTAQISMGGKSVSRLVPERSKKSVQPIRVSEKIETLEEVAAPPARTEAVERIESAEKVMPTETAAPEATPEGEPLGLDGPALENQ